MSSAIPNDSVFAPNGPKTDTGPLGAAEKHSHEQSHTSTQQLRAAVSSLRLRQRMSALPPEGLREEVMGGDGHAIDWGVSVSPIVNKTKLGIVAAMQGLGRPTFAHELYALWDRSKPLLVFDYHLCTLVRAGVAELVSDGPELRFQLVGSEPCREGKIAESDAA